MTELSKVSRESYFEDLKLATDVIQEQYGITGLEMLDLRFALCKADELYGTNNKELSIDRLLVGTGRLSPDLALVELPRVQQARVMFDSLVIALSMNGVDTSGIGVSSEASLRVANILRLSVSSEYSYATEDDLYEGTKVLFSLIRVEAIDQFVEEVINYLERTRSGIELEGKLVLPDFYKDKVKRTLVGVAYDSNAVFEESDRHKFATILADSIAIKLIDSMNLSCMLYMQEVSKVVVDKLNLSVSAEIIARLSRHARLNNSLLLVFNISNSDTDDYRGIKVLLSIMYCKPSCVIEEVQKICKGDK